MGLLSSLNEPPKRSDYPDGWFGNLLFEWAKWDFLMLFSPGGVLKVVGPGGKALSNSGKVARNLYLIKKVTEEVNLPMRISRSGMTNSQAGAFFGWGKGVPSKSVGDYTRRMLEQNGWTKDIIENVAEGYRKIGGVDPGNPSALPRAEQLESLLKLFE